MLIGYIILAIYLLSVISACFSGLTAEAGGAVMEGAAEAVRFCLSISGAMCLWSSVMEVMARSGVADALSTLLTPVLKRLFPTAGGDRELMRDLSENVSANLLGLGNAATPAGVRAVRGMARLCDGKRASDELCLFVVLNTASIQLLPTAIASVRYASGAENPFDIVPAVLAASAVALAAGLAASALLRRSG